VCGRFCCNDLDINPVSLKHEVDLDVLKMCLYTENEMAMLRASKLLMLDDICVAITSDMKKYENNDQGQRSSSNFTNFQSLLAFTVMHIPTKLHQFLICSFRDFLQRETHRHRQKQYLLVA